MSDEVTEVQPTIEELQEQIANLKEENIKVKATVFAIGQMLKGMFDCKTQYNNGLKMLEDMSKQLEEISGTKTE